MREATNRGERAKLCREGDLWTIEFGGVVRHVSRLKGFEHLSQLLIRPGEAVPALELDGRAHADGAEQARLNVTRAIHAALNRLDTVHPDLGAHLRATLRTGKTCSYRPDPRLAIHWQTEPRD